MLICSSRQPSLVLYSRWPSSPAGPLLIGIDETGALCRLSFLRGRTRSAVLEAWASEWPKTAFHAAKPTPKRLPKNVLLVGSAFQIKVWKQLLKIPIGKTISYGEMARRVKKPGAARAVGVALGANPVPLIMPCHRVIAANGGLGGFSGGLAVKRALLAHEGLAFR